MINFIDNFLNSITMYRLVLYYLILLLVVALIYSVFGLLPFTPFSLVFSVTILLAVSYVSNKMFEKFFKVQTNVESLYITALILALVINPVKSLAQVPFLVLAALLAIASKYILNINKKHIFNPASIAVLITGFAIGGFASWWVGTLLMLPFSLLGVLIVRKIRRFDMIFYFFAASLITIFGLSFLRGDLNIFLILRRTIVDTPVLFFAFVMLTEPLTTPPTTALQALYGVIVGIIFTPQLHFAGFFSTPEIALSIGNIFSYLVSPKEKLVLRLREKIMIAPDTYDFIFDTSHKLNFRAGQYLEWTLGHKNPDDRGNRRYFTISSSPTENNLRIGVKFDSVSSSYKRTMLSFIPGSEIVASQLAGDFTLPKDRNKKLVLIAGGIGVTPYRSIIKYLIDTNEKRDIVLLYSDKTDAQFVYKDIFSEAMTKFGAKVIYNATEKMGHVSGDFIKKEIPDYKERIFYVSGSHGMVNGFEDTLKEIGIPNKQIKIDYFPGF